MNIWIINHYAYTPADSAGTRHYSMARELLQRSHSVLIVASSFYHKARRERVPDHAIFRQDTIDEVPFLWLRTPHYSGNSVARIWNMLVFAWRVWRKQGFPKTETPDVILGSSPDLFAAYASYRLARRYRVPFVLEIHDLWPDTFIELGGFPRWHPVVIVMGMLERILYRRADLIITALPGSEERLVEKGADPETIVWIPNGVDLAMVPEPSPPPEGGSFRAMYAGAHGLANALDPVLDAAALLQRDPEGNGIEIVLIGEGAEKDRLVGRSETDGLKNVTFLPSVPKRDIYKKLAEADCFLSMWKRTRLYQWGISPNKLSDYLACARPVILAVDSKRNVVEAADAGLVIAPDDPEALAIALKKMRNMDPGERREMGLRGRKHVAEHFNYSKLALEMESAITRTLEKSRR